MKKIAVFILSVALFVGFSSCEKEDDKKPNCNVNGLWFGNWVGDDGSSGTFITPVTQNETEFKGDILIRFDLPSMENHGVGLEGKIIDQVAKASIEISVVDIQAKGNIANDVSVEGSFTVSFGLTGTFKGKKVPLDTIIPTEIFRCVNCQEFYESVIYVNGNLWLTVRSTDQIKKLNSKGEIMQTITGNFLNEQAVFDGTNFLMYGYNNLNSEFGLFSIDTTGHTVYTYTFSNPETGAICLSNNAFYSADNFNRTICERNMEGTSIKCLPTNYSSVDGMVYLNGNFFVISNTNNVLIKLDPVGNIVKAYRLPEGNIQHITSDNSGTIWCLVEIFNVTTSETGVPEMNFSDYSIVRFNPD